MLTVNILAAIKPLIDRGNILLRPEDGKIEMRSPQISPEHPWIHVVPWIGKDCFLPNKIIFPCFKLVPLECYECWKVVITPRTFEELMWVLVTMEEKIDQPCKCGIELRDITPRLYGGYIYNNSVEEGREWKERAVELFPGLPVRLKRACTEFEMALGPSDKWEPPEWQEDMEKELSELYIRRNVTEDRRHPEYVKMGYIHNWMVWAHGHGDMSYIKFNGGKSLYPETLEY